MGTLIHDRSETAPDADTYPKLLVRQAARLGARTAMREKQRGIWRSWSWAQVLQDTRGLARGLEASGFARGDRLLVIGENRPRLYWAMCAAQMLGGVALPVSADIPQARLADTLRTHGVRFAVADGQEQCDKLIDASTPAGPLQHILCDKYRGPQQSGADPRVRHLDEAIATGTQVDRTDPMRLDDAIARSDRSDVAVVLSYPTVTLGSPARAWNEAQQVAQTHAQGIAAANTHIDAHHFGPADELLAYLPLGGRTDQHFSFALALACGATVNFPESVDTVPIDIRELGPTLHVLPDWAFAQLHASIRRRLEGANAFHRNLFGLCLDPSGAVRRGKGVFRSLTNFLVRGPLRDVLGLSRTKILFIDGPDGKSEALNFFQDMGLRLEQMATRPSATSAKPAPANAPFQAAAPAKMTQ